MITSTDTVYSDPLAMSDARALLKAKRQEARVTHPLAAYSSSSQLRCVACGTAIKHASSWEGHVGSKAHRVNAAKLREQQQKQAEQARENGKRKAADDDENDDAMESDTAVKKRRLSPEEPPPVTIVAASKTPAGSSGFPSDFFSDPSKAPSPLNSDDENEEEAEQPPATAQSSPSAVDAEWEQFQQTVLNAPEESKQEAYERATVFAEPVLSSKVPEGFPPLHETGGESDAAPVPPTEDELRRKKEQDEKELIMDRLMDEERAQEEADAKVSMLKQRLENLRRQRLAAKVAKANST